MLKRAIILLALVVVVALPFALRPKQPVLERADDTLVIITPHNEAIRHEFTLAFRDWYRAKTGRSVAIDWRVIGGTAEIARFLESEYIASFRNRWTNQLHRPWSIDVQAGEVLGLVGESGCGKRTLGRCILRLVPPTSGQVLFEGQDIGALDAASLRKLRAHMQIVFQNPLSSLSPRLTIRASLEEPLRTHGVPRAEWDSRIANLLGHVGLGRQHLERYPHELSGGQCQRVTIARALSLEPRHMVLNVLF